MNKHLPPTAVPITDIPTPLINITGKQLSSDSATEEELLAEVIVL